LVCNPSIFDEVVECPEAALMMMLLSDSPHRISRILQPVGNTGYVAFQSAEHLEAEQRRCGHGKGDNQTLRMGRKDMKKTGENKGAYRERCSNREGMSSDTTCLL
jgi:hypothetical protein